MNEFKGTPGPWRVVTFQNNDEIHSAEGKCLADSWSYDIGSDCAVSLANAQVMAAAPELLSDLKEAAQLLRNYEKLHREKGTEDGTIKADRNRAWAEQFEATIAKALGEKP